MKWFPDYYTANPDAAITYKASKIIIKCDRDTTYLVPSEVSSRVAGFIYIGNKYSTNNQIINAPIMVIARALTMVVASAAAEAELAALFHNAREIVPLQIIAEEIDHPQPATEIRMDNTTAKGIADNTLKQQRSKAIDMRFYWIRDRISQNQFKIILAPGKTNIAAFFPNIIQLDMSNRLKKYI